MNKKSKLVLVLGLILLTVGIYLMTCQDERFDFVSGIFVGVGIGSLVSVLTQITKSNFDKTYSND